MPETKYIKHLKELLLEARNNLASINYTFEIRGGEIKRTIISSVYDGTDFGE